MTILDETDQKLDAWVEARWETAAAQFGQITTVARRQIHIDLPVQVGETLVEQLQAADLVNAFQRKTSIVLITGEGGAGKTSLACRMALWGLDRQLCRHRMLPILIEEELDAATPLLEYIRGRLGILTDDAEAVAPEFLQDLLKCRRLMVIVDHLSEMGEGTRRQITPGLPTFLINALVVTSRLEEPLGKVPKTTLKPWWIQGARLSRFMDAYLVRQNKRDLFEDEEYFDACRRLSRMVGESRKITVLLARLYADQMIQLQDGAGGTLPASVPELMLTYVNQLNRNIPPGDKQDDAQVRLDVQRVAWECLAETYRPGTAAKERVLTALAQMNQHFGAEVRLNYLEQRLVLVEVPEPGDKVRIILDPLAEYLAAAWLVDVICTVGRSQSASLLDEILGIKAVDFQEFRREKQRAELQEEWNLQNKNLGSLRRALVMESAAATRLQLEGQVKTAETNLKQLDAQLLELEGAVMGAESTPEQIAEQDQLQRWEQFFASIDRKLDAEHETPEMIQGFLLAVRDCCLLRQKQFCIPTQITAELARKAGLDPEELRRAEEKRRIRLLISDLSAPELEYRIRAAEDLGKRAGSSRMAIQNLIGMVRNPNQELEARQAAAKTLATIANTLPKPNQPIAGRGERLFALASRNDNNEDLRDQEVAIANAITADSVGPDGGEPLFAPRLDGNLGDLRNQIAECFLTLLADTQEDLAVRRSIAEALGLMNAGSTELLAILEDSIQPLPLRQGTARALSWIGAPSGQPVPMLIVEQHSGQVLTEVKQIPVYKTPLAEDLVIHWVAIPGGEFLMGSPPEEVGRDYYQYQSWAADTAGQNVEAQHLVKIAPFAISQYPVTQAQWQFVASLPKIEQDLNLDPSQHKGKNRPVDSVSWDDVQEFCARLTEHTGNPHRLPSEAEWEYACRAGTTSPYHFGETISAEWVNYDANYTYEAGETGVYRQGTTEVGFFGLSNRFGLAEMHGNVYEWCADHWHPSYEGAPADESPWLQVAGDDNRLRLLRGGSWIDAPACCRSAFRIRYHRANCDNTVGFRVAAASPPQTPRHSTFVLCSLLFCPFALPRSR